MLETSFCAGHVFSSQSPTDIGVVMMFHPPPTKVGIKVTRNISCLWKERKERYEEEKEEGEKEEKKERREEKRREEEEGGRGGEEGGRGREK